MIINIKEGRRASQLTVMTVLVTLREPDLTKVVAGVRLLEATEPLNNQQEVRSMWIGSFITSTQGMELMRKGWKLVERNC